jgi:hypothetical protein
MNATLDGWDKSTSPCRTCPASQEEAMSLQLVITTARRKGSSAIASAATLAATILLATGGAHADGHGGGGSGSGHGYSPKRSPIVNTIHSIVRHPPLHGAGSSHNPIVVAPNCNDPNTLCRRP